MTAAKAEARAARDSGQVSRNFIVAVALFGAVAGALFRGVFDDADSQTATNFALSSANGMMIALAMVTARRWWTQHSAEWLRERSLATEILLDVAVMAAAGIAANVVAQLALYGASVREIPALIPSRISFALVAASMFVAAAHIVRLIGPRQLISVLVGRYSRPVEEVRVILFVDLKDSTRRAEQLGPVRVAALITRFFHDIDDAIAEHGGEVHAYIGDEVIVTWPLDAIENDAAPIRCVFAMRRRLARRADSYVREFGVAPDFRAVLHCGPVVVAEIGRTKQQIGYFGDSMNVAARLEEHAKRVDRDILVSQDVIDRVALPADIIAEDLGEVSLRGRAAPLNVAALTSAP